jgi:hypothetical protein
MDILASMWAGQPQFVVVIALMIFAMGLSRFGARFLTGWLALTETNARRISRILMAGVWLLILLIWIVFRAGG